MTSHDGVPWAFGGNFLATLFRCGLFSSLFLGLTAGFASFFNEKKLEKALHKFAASSAIAFAFSSTATVIYSFSLGDGYLFIYTSYFVRRAIWWIVLAFSLSMASGYINDSWQVAGRTLAGLVPGLFLSGLFADFVCFANHRFFTGSLMIGLGSGLSLGLIVELLKEAWIEQAEKNFFIQQVILDKDEYTIGYEDACDFTIEEFSSILVIFERDGLHVLEVIEGDPVSVNKAKIRYHCLVEDDTIRLGDELWVYRSRYSRGREIIPEGLLGG
ncbi:MAG: hypothetical protein HQM08_00490 [Candidatus Riflebacteria bacterium]|nr:hypothetical protein [Candidatus Riflebacteria bacterium]